VSPWITLAAIASVNSLIARNTDRHNHRVELDYGVERTEGESQPDRISRRLISFTCQRGGSRRARRPNDKTRLAGRLFARTRDTEASKLYRQREPKREQISASSRNRPETTSFLVSVVGARLSSLGVSAPIALLLYFAPCIRSRTAGEVRVLRPRPPLCHPPSPTTSSCRRINGPLDPLWMLCGSAGG